ncbi:hypothetical protein H5V43_03940 [Sphingobium fuliginis]|jgi:hypothetical protein|uniref:DUF5983 domain-containing protein n=1 Tax=Sphingobium fuliginis (strain ATCC 27551) TaxID=336203 RepID=A0A7M2GIR5_SPHSA|nr:hypothetical protein [Sphingobium fuliginis]QOT72305.1 hypothetical protein H5V43_03940 [Sphingobium fuliginis]
MTDTSKRDLARLLTRARRAIEDPARLVEHDRAALLGALASAETHVAGSPMPWSLEIHIASVEHRHGLNHYVALTSAELMSEVAAYCRECWTEISDARDPATLDDETVASSYFDNREDEHLSTDRIELGASPPAAGYLLETGWYCVLANAHLSTSTADLLDQWCSKEATDRPLNIASSIYGWFVPTRQIDPGTHDQLPDDLLAAIRFGRERGFDHILFDCDAGTADGLPVHSW